MAIERRTSRDKIFYFSGMISISICLILLKLCSVIPNAVCLQGWDRELYFPGYYFFADKRLMNHTIKTEHVKNLDFCELLCYQHHDCVSLNIKKDRDSTTGQQECELNNSTHMEHDGDLINDNTYLYRGAKNACGKNPPCHNKAICQSGFTDKGYRCLCAPGFTGEYCKDGTDIDECTMVTLYCNANAICNNTKGSYQCTCKQGFSGDGKECKDIDECAKGTDNCSADAVCNNTKGSHNCTCKPGYYGDGRNCRKASTCKEIHDWNMLNVSQVVTLQIDSKPISVFCHVGNFVCGDGGWTPVMKIDGNKNTFRYDSEHWSDQNEYNIQGGETGFDTQETKLPTYWNTSFSKICLGMKIDQQLNFIVINKQANSLYSLIADGQYRNTSLGRDTWKTLIGSEASLQLKCNKEGFNAVVPVGFLDSHSKARIGILGNQENHCDNCDSRIGFGTGGSPDDSNTCGNEAAGLYSPDNGERQIKAMGYVLVQ